MTSKVVYLGQLRTENTHLSSGMTYITDAPLDNHGLASAFSPTDIVATALADCMLTVMAIKADAIGVELKGSSCEVTKIMTDKPRRISEIYLKMLLPKGISDKHCKILENTAKTCPVHHSLHPDIRVNCDFCWG